MASRFGGVEINESQQSGSRFGGVPVEEESPRSKSLAEQPWSPSGVIKTMGTQAGDFAKGAVAGAASTVFHGGELIRSGLRGLGIPMERVIDRPEVKSGMTEPDTTAGTLGKFTEQAAEFVGPSTAATTLTKGMGLGARMLVQAAASAPVAVLQTGEGQAALPAAALGAAGPALGATVGAIGRSRFPQKLYQSALKPTWAMEKKAGESLVKTGLEEGIPVSSAGLAQAENKIDAIRREISSGIQMHAAQGKTVDSSKVLDTLNDLEDFYRKTAAPQEGLDAIQHVKDEFNAFHGQQIPVDVAQQIKINTYSLLRKSYGEMKAAKVEAVKQVARGLKEQISQVFPEIASLNEQQSHMLDLTDALHRAVWRIENHQMMGIGSPLAASAGHALLGGPGAVAGFVGKLVLDDPTVKSKLAIALSKAGAGTAQIGPKMEALKAMIQKSIEEEPQETAQ